MKRWENAGKALEGMEAILSDKDGRNAKWWNDTGSLYCLLENYPAGLAMFEEALKISPDNLVFLKNTSVTFYFFHFSILKVSYVLN